MIVAEVAAPAAPAIGAGAIALGACVIFAFLWAFDKAFRALFAPLLTKVANIGFGGVHGFGAVHPFGFLHAIVSSVEHWTNAGLAQSERAISWGFNTAWAIVKLTTLTTERLAGDLAQSVANLWHHAAVSVPKVVRTTIVKPIVRTVTAIDAKATTRINSLTHELHALEAKVAHGAHVVAHAGAVTIPQIGRLERDAQLVGRRITKLEKSLRWPLLAALVLSMLARLGFGFLRCSGWQKVGRRITCGMSRFFESLLALAIDTLVITNLCETTKLLTRLAYDVLPLVSALTHGVEKLMECQGATRAPDLTLQAADLPALDKSVISI